MTVKSGLAGSNVCGEIRVLWFTTWARGQSGLKGGGGQGTLLHWRPAIPFPHFLLWPRVRAEDHYSVQYMDGDKASICHRGAAALLAFQLFKLFLTGHWTPLIHHSFIHLSIHLFIHSIHSFFKQLCVPAAPPAISGGLNSFNEHTSGYKGRVYITGLWPTAAGTTPLLSPVIWLSPFLLATEGKGYYSFVAFESKVLSELPSLSSSSQITLWGIFMTTSQFSPEKAERRKPTTHHRIHSDGEAQQSQILTIPLLPLCPDPPETPSQTILQKNLNWLKLKEKGHIKLTIHYILCQAFFFFLIWIAEPTLVWATPGQRGRPSGCKHARGGRARGNGQCACVHVRMCGCVRERDRGREIEGQRVTPPSF